MSHLANDQVIDRILDLTDIIRDIQTDLEVAVAAGNPALEKDLLTELAVYVKELNLLKGYF